MFVGGTFPDGAFKHAVADLGLPFPPSRNALIRAGAKVASGLLSAAEAAEELRTHSGPMNHGQIVADVPDEIIAALDRRYSENRSFGLRVGILMLTGTSREAAEAWARATVRKPGRPKGAADLKPRKSRKPIPA
jgi:hypothetical protein